MDTKNGFRVVPLAPELAEEARRRPAHRRLDGERHQCRACLELTREDEPVLLLSHRPFATDGPYAERGPVFVHERPCRFRGDENAYPAEFPRRHAVLRAYSDADEIVDAEVVGDRRVEDVIASLIARPTVAYLHARNDAYGCYMFRIEPARAGSARDRGGRAG
jgi:uncharacterized protein DUF1203